MYSATVAQATTSTGAWLVLAVSVVVVALLWAVGYYAYVRTPERDERADPQQRDAGAAE